MVLLGPLDNLSISHLAAPTTQEDGQMVSTNESSTDMTGHQTKHSWNLAVSRRVEPTGLTLQTGSYRAVQPGFIL